MAEDMARHNVEKTCADCKCRNCDAITAMAERVDAYKSAQAMLKSMDWPEGTGPTPTEVLILANWLYSGLDAEDDD